MEPPAKKSNKKKTNTCQYCERSFDGLFREHLLEHHRFTDKSATKSSSSGVGCLASAAVTTPIKIPCPVEGCHKNIDRLDKHLQTKKHNIHPGQADYHRYLKMGSKSVLSIVSNKGNKQHVEHDTETKDTAGRSSSSSNSSSKHKSTKRNDDDDADYVPSDNDQTSSDSENDDDDDDDDDDDTILSKELCDNIAAFKKWLTSFGGGQKSEEASRQTSKQVRIVLQNFGDRTFTDSSVIDNLDQLEAEFIPGMLENRQASTVKNYLLAFQKFVRWAQMKRKTWISTDCANSINNHVQCWNTSLHKLISTRAHETKSLHRKRIVTVEQIQAYVNGDRAETAQEILTGELETVSKQDHTNARNHLIILLVLSNATRAGPIINLKINDVVSAEDNIHGDRCVMNVLVHKTEQKYGTAQISLSVEEYELLRAYIDNIRSRVPAEAIDDEAVFITWSGRPMNQSEVANVITVELIRAGGRNIRTSCTMMRKSIVSILLQMDLGARTEQDLASLMKHSQMMQKKTYDIRVADTAMAKMSGMVYKIITGNLTESDIEEETV